MKKIHYKLLAGLMLAFSCIIPFTACDNGNDGKTVVRLNEVTHSFFYAPLYAAINKGYFADENIEIKLTNGGGADKVMTALITDAADIGLLGPEATIYVQVQNAKNYPIIFGQLTNCDGAFLIGRSEQPDFKWSDLRGKKIIAGRKGGMPAMALQYVINQAGVNLNELASFDTSIAFNLMGPAFDGDKSYDYTTLFEPAASVFASEGKGHIITSIGKDSGAIPYTCFSATKNYMAKNPEVIKAFLRAVQRGRNFIKDSTSDEVARALQPSFSDTSLSAISVGVSNYLAINAWKDDLVLIEGDFDRLQNIMQNAGELPIKTSFSVVVDNQYAQSVKDAA